MVQQPQDGSTNVPTALLLSDLNHTNERINKLEDRVSKVEEKNEMLYNMTLAINLLSKTVNKIDNNVEGLREDMTTEISGIKTTQQLQDKRIDELSVAPAKQDQATLKLVKTLILTIVVTGIVVFVLSQVIPGVNW